MKSLKRIFLLNIFKQTTTQPENVQDYITNKTKKPFSDRATKNCEPVFFFRNSLGKTRKQCQITKTL